VAVYDLAAQWGGYPWDIDLSRLSAQDVARSEAYVNYQNALKAKAARKSGDTSRRTFGG